MKAGLLVFACLVAVVQCVVPRTMQRIPRATFVKESKATTDEVHALIFAVQQNNLVDLEKTLLQRSTPGSALYQQWLTYDEISAMTVNTAGTEAIVSWLNTHGAKILWKSNRGDYIKAEAPVEVWEQLLQAEFYQFSDHSRKNPLTGQPRKLLRTDAYTVPAELHEHLFTVFHTVQTPPELRKRHHTADEIALEKRKVKPEYSAFRSDLGIFRDSIDGKLRSYLTYNGLVTVDFLNQYYHITTNTGNATQQQAVFETADEHFSPNDLTLFQNKYNLPLQEAEAPFGYTTTDCVTNSCYEGNLDVQYIMGVAQQTATIYWYQEQTDTSDPFVDWITDVANASNPPLVNSISWGSIEQANTADVLDAFNTEAIKLGAMGVTVFVSSGDDGVAADGQYCNYNSGSAMYPSMQWTGLPWTGKGYFPSFPATSPYVTALGATMGPESGNAEVACEADGGGVITTGGGFSSHFPTPSWQQDAVNAYFETLPSSHTPVSGFNPNGRGFPDVSMIGVWYQTYVQGQVLSLFGTSASAPVFAAMVSLINGARAAEGMPPVGFINPTLYAYAAQNKTMFNDIISGDNKCTSGTPLKCCDSGFYTNAGWDPVTGWGSIFYPNLGIMFGLDYEYVEPNIQRNGAVAQATLSGAAVLAAGLAVLALLVQ